jgi:hypothetical protein
VFNATQTHGILHPLEKQSLMLTVDQDVGGSNAPCTKKIDDSAGKPRG